MNDNIVLKIGVLIDLILLPFVETLWIKILGIIFIGYYIIFANIERW